MSKTQVKAGGISLSDTFAFTGTVTGVGGITVAQQFRLAADQAGSGSTGTVLSNYEENDTDYQALGSAFSESSGVFSCSQTGVYLCNWTMTVYGSDTGDGFDPNIQISTDSGSNYYMRSRMWGHTDAGTGHDTIGTTFMFDVANTSTFRLRFRQSASNAIDSGTDIKGDTNLNFTQITFVRLGDT